MGRYRYDAQRSAGIVENGTVTAYFSIFAGLNEIQNRKYEI